MKILVLNSGSSSVKYQLFLMPEQKVICSGVIDRIGQLDSSIKFNSTEFKIDEQIKIANHKEALDYIVKLLLDHNNGVITSVEEIDAVGHRVVHGGNDFKDTIEINKNVKNTIEELSVLAPLHNPPNLKGISVAEAAFSKAKQVAVFDTAFHQTIPEVAHKYAIPNVFFDDHKIRLYGFHGTSHKYVSEKAVNFLGKKNSKIISIHLGNGCSITAIKNGRSIDHSLGFAPVNGLIMGTRSGDIDHSLIFYLVNTLGYNLDEVDNILQRESGMLGLTGFSDLRDIESEAEKGDKACKVALAMNAYRIKKYIGGYIASMNGLDCLIFTAGIGENSAMIRELVCSDMETFGIKLDIEKNRAKTSGIRDISHIEAQVRILVIPTNEELEIAMQTYKLIKNKSQV
ncbi:acetate/propionate family kinase [Winogradskyella alexanderae]|uniref:Acetate kinase n=1 Tax=Winogradskyella alexanderae TaxID=2877123 RepID=A0ABS7XUU7_9FLAO|nr:acetate kinase [Winogradskyella alexanderae]MCA0133560.1 acetate kinase [Winogradskyella alexanderae]